MNADKNQWITDNGELTTNPGLGPPLSIVNYPFSLIRVYLRNPVRQ
jgi:hypothetical protein